MADEGPAPDVFRRAERAHVRALGRTQADLARAVGLHPNVLSHKLHEHGGAILTQRDVVDIVRVLAAWGALTSQADAHALLAAMAVPLHAISAASWAAPPFAALLPAALPVPRDRAYDAQPSPSPGNADARLTLPPIPAPLTPLIGRAAERAVIQEAFAAARLVTLTGVGGTGKTRLAVHCAHEAAADGRFADGVAFADLSPLRDPTFLALTLTRALGLPDHPTAAPEVHLLQALRSHSLLLVVDNMEHLLEAAPLLGRLLMAAPRLHLLVTSRVPLRLYGEHILRIPPLHLASDRERAAVRAPATRAQQEDAPLSSTAAASEAARLFVARARAVLPGFDPTGDSLAAVEDICTMLDGLPLAIELAAARVALFPPEALRTRLGGRPLLLADGPRDLPERQRAMRAAFDWSHALLSPEERTLFARLGVFAGPFDAAAAAAVCASEQADEPGRDGETRPWAIEGDAGAESEARTEMMLGRLAALADQSLLNAAPGARPRFRMLETVRAYALAHLAMEGSDSAIRRQHAIHYLALAEAAQTALLGWDQAAWLDRLAGDYDNLRAALDWSVQATDIDDVNAPGEMDLRPWRIGLRLAAALWRFWWVRGFVHEGRRWLEALLPHAGETTPERGDALAALAALASYQGDYVRARRLKEECLAVRQTIGEPVAIARALNGMALDAQVRGDYAHAEEWCAKSAALLREQQEWGLLAHALHNLAIVRRDRGDLAGTVALLEESVALKEARGDVGGIALALIEWSEVTRLQGDLPRAVDLVRRGLVLARQIGDARVIALGLDIQAEAAVERGDLTEATACLEESAALHGAVGVTAQAIVSQEIRGRVAHLSGRSAQAADLLRTATALRETLGVVREPHRQLTYECTQSSIWAALGNGDAAKSPTVQGVDALELRIRGD